MHDLKVLKSQNEDWHKEHTEWMSETLRWQQETKRLVAILYQLERALPEHSKALNRHVEMVKEHQRLVEKYEAGLDEQCYPKCPGFNSEDELEKMHQTLCQMHDKTEQDHESLSLEYAKKLAEFKVLAKKLLDYEV